MLPDPELYSLLDGRPTKDKVVWQTLVDVNDIKKAVNKLKETNWLYKISMKTLLMMLLKKP